MTEHTDLEQRAARLLRGSTDPLDPDVEGMVRGGLARGRAGRRRRRVGTALAAVAVIGVVGAAASVLPGSADGRAEPLVRDGSGAPTSEPPTPDPHAVASRRIPAVVASVVPGRVTEVQPLQDGPDSHIAHFLWDGFATSAGVSPMRGRDPMAACRAEFGGQCVKLPDGGATVRGRSTQPSVDGGGSSRFGWRFAEGWVTWMISYTSGQTGGKGTPLADEPPFDAGEIDRVLAADGWVVR